MSPSFKTPIDTVGEILSGEMKGWFVKVEETQEGGSYLILQWRIIDPATGQREGYDNWSLPEDLDFYFETKGWDIEWKR